MKYYQVPTIGEHISSKIVCIWLNKLILYLRNRTQNFIPLTYSSVDKIL